jgi:hypothetical protein
VNSPLFTKRLSREEILTENLCDLPFFFRGPVHSRFSTTVKGGSDPTFGRLHRQKVGSLPPDLVFFFFL